MCVCAFMCARMGDFRQCGFVPAAKRSFPVGEVFQLSLQHTRTHTPAHGSLIGLCSRMPDSLKILVNVETDTMECFVRDVSASVLPERIFLSKRHQSGQKCVCVRACVCVCDRLTVFCGAPIRPLLPPSCFVSFRFLRPSAVSSLFRSPLRPSLRESSDISRVCPAPHSSAASEECLVHNKQLSSSSIMISVLLLLSF